ncbi:UNVERIFIED_CONTAM: hypothetical protein RMT77_016709 [Armadillidium vulgare]
MAFLLMLLHFDYTASSSTPNPKFFYQRGKRKAFPPFSSLWGTSESGSSDSIFSYDVHQNIRLPPLSSSEDLCKHFCNPVFRDQFELCKIQCS